MDLGSAGPGALEEDGTLPPKEQAPLDWTESIDWTIERSPEVRRIYARILSDPGYKAQSKFLYERFLCEKKARVELRRKKQLAYAQKNSRRRPHSSQCRSVNVQRFVIATIRREWKPVVIEGQQYVLRLPDEEGNVQAETSDDEDPETGQTPLDIVRSVFENCVDATPLATDSDLLHWRIPLGAMERLLEKDESALTRPRLLRHLRLRSCSWDLILHEDIAVPRRGNGKGSKSNPTDIDEATGELQNAVLLLRILDHCEFQTSSLAVQTLDNNCSDSHPDPDVRCAICRQKPVLENIPSAPSYRPRLWTQRDTRGDLAIAKKIAAKQVLEANKFVPCCRGSASNPILAPITKRTRSINWGRNFGIRTKRHKNFLANARIEREKLKSRGEPVPVFPHGTALSKEHPEWKRRQQKIKQRRKKHAERVRRLSEKLPVRTKGNARKYPESTTDEIAHILRTDGGGPLCHFETAHSARIAGTKIRICHDDGKYVLKERIRLCSRTLMYTQRELRQRARDRVAGREAPPWGAGSREARRLQNVAKRVAARWIRAGLVSMVAKWKAFVVQRQRDRKIVGRWLITVENIELMKGWRSWQEFVEECRANELLTSEQLLKKKWADMRRREKETKCRRVVLRMLHAKLNSGWGAWREYLRVKGVLQRIGARWIKRGMVKCLNRWREWLAQRKVDQGIVRSWLFSVENRELMAGWRSWMAFVRLHRQNEELEGVQALELEKQH